MDISYNLKRRRDSEESQAEEGEKNILKKHPKIHPSNKLNLSHNPPANHNPRKRKTKEKHPRNQLNSFLPHNNSNNNKNTPTRITEPPLSPTLPSLSPVSTPKIFSRSHSESRDPKPSSSTRKKNKSVSNETRQVSTGLYFCADTLDHHLKKTLNPLIHKNQRKGCDQSVFV